MLNLQIFIRSFFRVYNELESYHEDISMFSWWFLLLYKTEHSQPPRAFFHLEGLKVITMGSGMEGKAKNKPCLRVKFREKPSSSPPTPRSQHGVQGGAGGS